MKLTLHGRQTQLLCHIGVLNRASLVEGHTANELGQITRRSDSATTAESLEDNVVDTAGVLVHANLQLHDIATGGGTDETSADVLVTLLHGTDISGVIVVIQDLLVVSSALLSWGGSSTTDGGLSGLQAGEGRKGTACCDRADTGSNGDKALEHCELLWEYLMGYWFW